MVYVFLGGEGRGGGKLNRWGLGDGSRCQLGYKSFGLVKKQYIHEMNVMWTIMQIYSTFGHLKFGLEVSLYAMETSWEE